MSNFLPIKYDGVSLCDSEPLYRQLFWVSLYEWDVTPYGLTIRIFGFNFDFLLGKREWIYDPQDEPEWYGEGYLR